MSRKLKFREEARALEAAMRAGAGEKVRAAISAMPTRAIDRADYVTFARLSWRAGLPELGLRLLGPLVRDLSASASADDGEKAEYAMCLVKTGAIDEGLTLLEALPPSGPRVALYRALGYASCWEYRLSIPLLKQHLDSRGLSAYDRIVAGVNLAAALVYERKYRRAETVLRDLLYNASLGRHRFALGASLEFCALNCINQGKYDRAEEFLARAAGALAGTASLNAFFVRRWRAVIEFRRAGGKDGAVLDVISREAAALGHWETVRDCDRERALGRGDAGLLLQVYAGTPHATFRENLLREFGRPLAVPAVYHWQVAEGERATTVNALTSGRLKPGQLLYRLLRALSRDFYRPTRVASLHLQLFPGEHYNPVTSPRRVHEAVRRFRTWLGEDGSPLDVAAGAGGYRLVAGAPCRLEIPLAAAAPLAAAKSGMLDRLREIYPSGVFSVKEASTSLRVSERTLSRLLREGERRGVVQRSGQARATRFRMTG